MLLDGSRSDLIVLKFEEHSGAGYLWQFDELSGIGLAIKDDHREAPSEGEHVGGSVLRTVIAEADDDGGKRGRVRLREARPWEPRGDSIASLEIDLDLSGPVRAGLLPAQRATLLSVA
jgi:predicted secreted protein